jgi:hypothetical protein
MLLLPARCGQPIPKWEQLCRHPTFPSTLSLISTVARVISREGRPIWDHSRWWCRWWVAEERRGASSSRSRLVGFGQSSALCR